MDQSTVDDHSLHGLANMMHIYGHNILCGSIYIYIYLNHMYSIHLKSNKFMNGEHWIHITQRTIIVSISSARNDFTHNLVDFSFAEYICFIWITFSESSEKKRNLFFSPMDAPLQAGTCGWYASFVSGSISWGGTKRRMWFNSKYDCKVHWTMITYIYKIYLYLYMCKECISTLYWNIHINYDLYYRKKTTCTYIYIYVYRYAFENTCIYSEIETYLYIYICSC